MNTPRHHRRLARSDDLSSPVLVVDDEFMVLAGSDVLESLLGIERSAIVGTPLGRWLVANDVEFSPRLMAMLGGTYQMHFLGDDGLVTVLMRVQPLAAGGDEWGIWVERVVSGTIDLTRGEREQEADARPGVVGES